MCRDKTRCTGDDNPINIGMVVQDFPPDARGAGFYAYYLSKHLQKRGFKVTVFTRGDTSCTTVEQVDGIRVYRVRFIPVYPFHLTLYRRWLKQTIRNCAVDFDLWHYHNPMIPSLETAAPIVLTEHGTTKTGIKRRPIDGIFSVGLKLFAPLYVHNERQLIEQATKVTAVSEACASEVAEYYGRQDVEVVYNGVDSDYFTPGESNSVESTPTVLYTGAHHPRKGLETLLHAVKQLQGYNSRIKFVLTGSGPHRENLIQISSNLGIEDLVEFPGYVSRDRLLKYYQDATLFVNPSRYEGLPTSVLEAMACGLPVVATDIPSHDELIISNKNGLLVPPNNSSELAVALRNLLDDQDRRRRFAERAREIITQKYDWEVVTERIINVYGQILSVHQ